jgi:hypothetical protein
MAAAVSCINNTIPLFPGAATEDKFSQMEIVELLEWSLPQKWRTKFDLDGYVPTLDDKAHLIASCEALERNEPSKTIVKKSTAKTVKLRNHKLHNKGQNGSGGLAGDKGKILFCSGHGKNPTYKKEIKL